MPIDRLIVCGLLVALTMLQQAPAESGRPHSYSHGTISNTCGPTDIPELVLLLAEKPMWCSDQPPRHYIHVSVNGPFPQTITLPAKNPYGQAYRAEENEKGIVVNQAAVSGTIVIDRSGRKGHYELIFKNGDIEAGDFKVTECISRIVCP